MRAPRICFPFLLLAAVAAVYWPIFKYPFIQDDWGYLPFIAQNAEKGLLAQVSPICCIFFYRPLGFAYFSLVYNLFGLDALGFHAFAFVLHFLTSAMVVHIVHLLLHDEVLSWATGFLYAAA